MNKQEFKRGDVICVDLGNNAVGSVQAGKRSMIVISNNIGNKYSPVLICCPLTSRVKRDMPTHLKLTKEMYKIKSDSIVICEQIMTISKEQVVGEKFFTINDLDQKRLNKCLAVSIAMDMAI